MDLTERPLPFAVYIRLAARQRGTRNFRPGSAVPRRRFAPHRGETVARQTGRESAEQRASLHKFLVGSVLNIARTILARALLPIRRDPDWQTRASFRKISTAMALCKSRESSRTPDTHAFDFFLFFFFFFFFFFRAGGPIAFFFTGHFTNRSPIHLDRAGPC